MQLYTLLLGVRTMFHPWTLHLVTLLLVSSSTAQNLIRLPSRSECRTRATTEHCLTQDMQQYCRHECAEHHNRKILEQNRIPLSPKATSFYQLSALDARGNQVNFEQFRDKVVLVTNVASFCGECYDVMHVCGDGRCCGRSD